MSFNLDSEDNLAQLRQAVVNRKPVFGEVMKRCGQKTVVEHIISEVAKTCNFPNKQRQAEFILAFADEVHVRYGADVAESATGQLQEYYLASTADHSGPLSAPDFINSHLSCAVAYRSLNKSLKHIIVLACSNISMHTSTFPRGFMFHSFANNEIKTNRIPFIPKSMVGYTFYGLKPFSNGITKKTDKAIDEMVSEHSIDEGLAFKLKQLMGELCVGTDNLPSYSEQVAVINNNLWNKLLPGKDSGYPSLVYLEQEDLVAKLLIDGHLYKDTIINHLIFDKNLYSAVEEYFNDIEGAFALGKNLGSYLFWAVPKSQKYRTGLHREGDRLISEDGTYEVELTPDAIAAGLKSKELIPSALLDFTVMTFYYGLRCWGGTSQINYTSQMKIGYLKLAEKLGDKESYDLAKSIDTDMMNVDLYLGMMKAGGQYIPATGIDLLLYGEGKILGCFEESANSVVLEEAMKPAWPEYYSAMYGPQERDPILANITLADLLNMKEYQQKVKPVIKF